MNLQTGAFGDPTNLETLILFWSKMEELHYPGSATTRKFLEEKYEREMMMTMGQGLPGADAPPMQNPPALQAPFENAAAGQLPPEMTQAIEQRARQDAYAAARAR